MAAHMAEDDTQEESKLLQFHEMGLDDRLLKAISKLGWSEPTLIQERAITLALEGKDILARARTGSGKTAAFAVPIIQHILQTKQLSRVQETKALVMAPTRELCHQIHKNFLELTISCSREVRCVDISGQADVAAQRPLLVDNPDVVIGTPSRVLTHMQAHNLNLKESLKMLAIDEADLVFSFGYEKDIKTVLQFLPKIYQAFLMSATLTDDVKSLKKIVLHNPVILKLEEPSLPTAGQLTHYNIKCEEEDKFIIIYAMFKLMLIRGKTLIFLKSVDRCYKMKLFLEQFGIGSCVLNAELPVSSRCHIVSQFNGGMYDIIIASDEKTIDEPTTSSHQKKKKRKTDNEYGVSRGIDFQFVSNVINFDFPLDVKSYIHRVGRTARGNNEGTALSFVSIAEIPLMEAVEKDLSETDELNGQVFIPYQFRMSEIEGFRYRARDKLRAVTRIAIREARLKEIRKEILNSQKLKSYFEDNPRDHQLLRHDRALHTVSVVQHLKDIPDYIIPPTLKRMAKMEKHKRHKQQRKREVSTRAERKFERRKADPLKSFEFKGFKKRRGKNANKNQLNENV